MTPSRPPPPRPTPSGLHELRRRGAVTELLFLFECTAEEPTQLRPIAEKLGVTVQAASHLFRQLVDRGLAEVRDGRYRATVTGVAWLHRSLGILGDDVVARLDRLNVVRTCRAIALADLKEGSTVSLVLRDGLLSAQPGTSGASRGRVVRAAVRGEIVNVDRLEGIVPILRGRVRVITVPALRLDDPALVRQLEQELSQRVPSLLAALGLEAYHMASRAVDRPIVRFGVAAACQEASRVGVDSTVVVLDEDLPRLLQSFGEADAPPFEVTSLEGAGRRSGASGPVGRPRAGPPRRRVGKRSPTPARR
jgi:predicted transcriptional regulator